VSDSAKLSEADKAYFAGLVDANSAIHIDRRYRGGGLISREIILRLNGLSKGQVDWVRARFKHGRIIKSKNSDGHCLRFGTRWAATALVEVVGHVIAKAREVSLVFRFASAVGRSGRRLTEEQERVRAEVDQELTALKRGA